MAKKIVDNKGDIVVEPLQTVNEELNYTDKAFSIAKTDNGYAVIMIKYNLERNLVGPIVILQDGMERTAAQSLMKVNVAKEILLR